MDGIYGCTIFFRCKKIGAKVIVEDIFNELNYVKDLIEDYISTNNATILEDIIWEVNNKSKFTAFKRYLLRDNGNDTFRTLIEPHIIN